MKELEHRQVESEGLSLQLRTTCNANGLLQQALDEANTSLLETSKVCSPKLTLKHVGLHEKD